MAQRWAVAWEVRRDVRGRTGRTVAAGHKGGRGEWADERGLGQPNDQRAGRSSGRGTGCVRRAGTAKEGTWGVSEPRACKAMAIWVKGPCGRAWGCTREGSPRTPCAMARGEAKVDARRVWAGCREGQARRSKDSARHVQGGRGECCGVGSPEEGHGTTARVA